MMLDKTLPHSFSFTPTTMIHDPIRAIKVAPYSMPALPSTSLQELSSTRTKNRRKRHKNIESTCHCVQKYCDSTSLHGFKYLSEPERPFYERFYWIIAIVFAFLVVGYVIKDQVEHFLRSPVLISFESTQTPVNAIPFPAITLCPDTQLKTKFMNLSHTISRQNNLTEEEKLKFYLALRICNIFTAPDGNFSFTHEAIDEMVNTINDIDTCHKIFNSVVWEKNFYFDPCIHIQPTITFYGACFTFNMLPLDQILRHPRKNWASKNLWGKKNIWTPDDGYSIKKKNLGSHKNHRPPWTVRLESSTQSVAIFLLKIHATEYDDICSSGGHGLFGYVHNPAELPGQSHPVLYAEENRMLLIQVQPKMYTVDTRLKNWRSQERGCYFDTERYLKYYNIYTQRNCEAECEVNFTLKYCGCLPFHHPNDQDHNICGPSIYNCLQQHRDKNNHCDCLPSCSELQYEITSISIKRKWPDHFLNRKKELDPGVDYVMVELQYESRYVQGVTRAVMFGLSDFVANIGGLLGLFLGFSLLSVVEVIYFLTLRICTKFRKDHAARQREPTTRTWNNLII